jgi:hypothetical protein
MAFPKESFEMAIGMDMFTNLFPPTIGFTTKRLQFSLPT